MKMIALSKSKYFEPGFTGLAFDFQDVVSLKLKVLTCCWYTVSGVSLN
jgi:hypothetical protein